MRTFINSIGLIFIILLILTFSMQNTHPVELKYYFNIRFSCSAYLLVLLPFFIGVIGGNIMDLVQRFKLKKEIKALKRELKEGEIKQEY